MPQQTTQWLTYAIASGACAAVNGAFAKLTTTELTTTWATSISNILGLASQSLPVEYAVRTSFFLMNLAFNGVMWGLFTRALALSNSTVRVSIINTSANFMITALLGAVIFGEELPGMWWIGASLLVVGSVIIGRRDESGESSDVSGSSEGLKDKVGTAESRKDGDGVGTASGMEKSAQPQVRQVQNAKER